MNRFLRADWKDLTHAYGSAEDVPALLADLNSPSASKRQNAISELFGNIWHQGTVYPATVKAVPALVALLKSPTCLNRESIVVLLASIADGEGYYNVHGRFSRLRTMFEKRLAEEGSSIAAEVEKETEYLQIIREMAREFMPLIEGYLQADDATVRETVAGAMIRHFDVFPHYEQLVRTYAATEEDEDAREVVELRLKEYSAERAIRMVRDVYVGRLVAETARLRSEQSDPVYSEAALRRADGDIARDGSFQLGMRVDAVIPAKGATVRIDSTSVMEFESITIDTESVGFVLSPFQWDWCVVTLECKQSSFSFERIVEWFDRWFDPDDEKLPDERGICGVVHFLDDPRFSDGRVVITTDLGSAPIEAFYELLDACAESRPARAWVSNAAVTGEPR
jgi:hypothetical protein